MVELATTGVVDQFGVGRQTVHVGRPLRFKRTAALQSR